MKEHVVMDYLKAAWKHEQWTTSTKVLVTIAVPLIWLASHIKAFAVELFHLIQDIHEDFHKYQEEHLDI